VLTPSPGNTGDFLLLILKNVLTNRGRCGNIIDVGNNTKNTMEGSEMEKYKGYYISKNDHGCFQNRAEVDAFLREQAISAYRLAVKAFAFCRDVAHSDYVTEKEEVLSEVFGLDWDEIAEIENNVYAEIA
jgi:hypothetical protein